MSIYEKELIVSLSTGNREGEKRRLLIEALRCGRSIRLRVFGISMVPTIWPGDTVVVEPTSGENPIGTLLLIVRDDRFYMHRLTGVEKKENGTFFITRGDAMKCSDPAVGREQLLGTVTCVTRCGREIVPQARFKLFQRVIAFAFCQCPTVRAILLHFDALRRHPYASASRTSLSHEIPA